MISKFNKYLQVKVSEEIYKVISQFSSDYGVSISNFCEYCINSVISDLGYRTKKFNNIETQYFLQQFADQINILYRKGSRSK